MLWILVGCGPGTFTEDEAKIVFDAVLNVNADAYSTIYAASAPDDDTGSAFPDGAAKGLKWYSTIDGGTFDGTIDGPGSWTGALALEGEYAITLQDLEAWSWTWSMDATYMDVGYGELTLTGDFAWSIQAEVDESSVLYASTVKGNVVGAGLATGAGAMDYSYTVSLSGGRYIVTIAGELAGYDISTSYDATAYGL